MDETNVDAIFGKHENVFGASSSKVGGYRSVKSTYGMSNQITTVVAISASAIMFTPLLIIYSKRLLSEWWKRVDENVPKGPSGIISHLTKANWFPFDKAAIKDSEDGSMEGPMLEACIKHIDTFVRNTFKDESYVLANDGPVSRK